MSCGIGCRRSSDLELLWLWRRPAATAPIPPLAWEPLCAAELAKRQKKKRKKERKLIQLASFVRQSGERGDKDEIGDGGHRSFQIHSSVCALEIRIHCSISRRKYHHAIFQAYKTYNIHIIL